MTFEQFENWLKLIPYLEDRNEEDTEKENKMVELKHKEKYQDMDILVDGVKVGELEIELESHMLSRLVIFDPYQNKGYGQKAVELAIRHFDIDNLWVRSDNKKAIHVYEKCGFKKSEETMFEMKLGG